MAASRNKALPEQRAAALKEREIALTNIRAGRPPDWRSPHAGEVVDFSDKEALAKRAQRSLEGKLDALLAEQRKTNSLAMLQLTPTADLNDRISSWRQTAETTPDALPYAEYGDRDAITAVLRQRAAANDARAAMTLETLDGIESALLRAAGVAAPNGTDQEQRELLALRPLVDALGQGGMERLAPVEQAVGPYLRAADRANPEAAKYRSDVENPAVARRHVIPYSQWAGPKGAEFVADNHEKFQFGEFVRGRAEDEPQGAGAE